MEIADWRIQIDEIDEQILQLLNRRAVCALGIGEIKKQTNMRIHDPEREKSIMKRLTALNDGPLTNDGVRRVFERIIDESRKLEKDL
jgi:chorismate mutase-like protein